MTRCRGSRGQVGGIEVLPFGLLVFVGGTLLLVNIWGVVDTKFAADSAAREATRWVVESAGTTDDVALRRGATRIAQETMADHGRSRDVVVDIAAPDGVGRCARVEVTVRTVVPAVRVPFFDGYGDGFTVSATHGELVDPTRSGVAGVADCLG